MKKLLIILTICISFSSFSQSTDPLVFSDLRWRMIGPHRGGRTVGATGAAQQPNVFYIGVNNGGVWKTTDAGRTWKPIFDNESTGSIGDVAVAPSNPEVVYAASGEGLHRPDLSVGNGMYKSINGGKTWVHQGFDSAQQISGIAIDPKNENRVFIAVLGHPYGPNTARGIYRTLNGGTTWQKVLYINWNVGATQVAMDPSNPKVLYADLWENRHAPWENGEWNGKESGLFKSVDGGDHWEKLTNGLPTTDQGLGRIGFCIAPSNTSRLYATVDAGANGGIYRSDDAGASWKKMNADERYWGRGSDFAEVKADPKNADIVYTAGVVVWKSIDGGKTFAAFKGAPGGDDYHRIWINPDHPETMLIASDQGAVVTLNGGETFSSWYNQPTAQFYHVSTDNAFPYNVYGAQQESGSVGIKSRSLDGEITFREWHPVGAEEYGYVEADPLDPNIIYGGRISRYNKKTGQVQNIRPEVTSSGNYRFLRTAPIVFSPVDHKTLFFAGNVLFKTTSGGDKWDIISPDLSREAWDIPPTIGIYSSEKIKNMPRRGVIYTIGASSKDINVIWCGTDDGLIHLTKDGGKTWKNVTPPVIPSWSKISIIEASHFDIHTAYAAVNAIRLDDLTPHIYKTTNDGASWIEIINGLPNDPINSIKEDPQTKGLLFAGSETKVNVSFDDGNSWHSLRLNMPATSIRDLVIKDNDLVIGTHGRSFWILDDITPLRQQVGLKSIAANKLYKPADAYRVRWNLWPDTPLPPDEPAGENPPDGAIINYYLNGPATNVSLEIIDGQNKLVRKYSNHDTLYTIPDLNIPLYWIRPQQILSANQGGHRFIWDLHYQPLNVPPAYAISAIANNTSPEYTSPWVLPGTYTVKMNIDGQTFIQKILIKMDPRIKIGTKEIIQQFNISSAAYENRKNILSALAEIKNLKTELNNNKNLSNVNFSGELTNIETGEKGSKTLSFNKMNAVFNAIFNKAQESEFPLTSELINTFNKAEIDYKNLWTEWVQLKNKITIAKGR